MLVTELRCQSCIDRQIDQDGPTIALWQKNPICELCLDAILDNLEQHHFDVIMKNNPETFEERKALALQILDELEEIYDKWPLDKEETLKCHEDFYNHRPPAIINCSIAEIETIFSRRKGILYAVRHKDERWSTEIEVIKRAARAEANLSGVSKSKKEVSKIVQPNGESLKAKEKLAKSLGISLKSLLEIEAETRRKNFEKLVGQQKDTREDIPAVHVDSVSGILKDLQTKVKTEAKKTVATTGVKLHPITGKPMK